MSLIDRWKEWRISKASGSPSGSLEAPGAAKMPQVVPPRVAVTWLRHSVDQNGQDTGFCAALTWSRWVPIMLGRCPSNQSPGRSPSRPESNCCLWSCYILADVLSKEQLALKRPRPTDAYWQASQL